MIKILKKLNYKRKQNKEKAFMDTIMSFVDFEPIVNITPSKIERITFVIPGMPAYSGGHTSILRLGTQLHNMGYEINYISFMQQEKEEMISNAKINLKGYKGNILSNGDLDKVESDVVVATSWDSTFFAKKMVGYKVYFIQDYEPYFHLYGELFLFAKKTYELGFHMISLGRWNKHMIEKNCEYKGEIDIIDFPYEKEEYPNVKRNYETYKNKNTFKLAVYIKNTGKRAPYITQNILQNVKSEFAKDNTNLQINYYGEGKDFKCTAGENLGKLNKQQLFDLYKESDFGICASLTNISLVPYEMLATGLPLIEFEEGTYKYFLPENSAILTSFNWRDLYEEMKKSINNPDKILSRMDNAYSALEQLSWNNSAKQFSSILEGVREFK